VGPARMSSAPQVVPLVLKVRFSPDSSGDQAFRPLSEGDALWPRIDGIDSSSAVKRVPSCGLALTLEQPCSSAVFQLREDKKNLGGYMSRSKIFPFVLVSAMALSAAALAQGGGGGGGAGGAGAGAAGGGASGSGASGGAGPGGSAKSSGPGGASGPNAGQNNSAMTGSGSNSQSPGVRGMATDPATGQPYNPRNLNDPNNPANPSRPAR